MNNETIDEMSKRKQGRRSNGCGGVKLRGNTWFVRYTDALGKRREVSSHTSNKDEALRILATYTAPIRESKSQEEVKLRLQQSLDVLELRKDVSKLERMKLEDLAPKFLNHRVLADATNGSKQCYGGHLAALIQAVGVVRPNVKFMDEITMEVADAVMGELTKRYTPASYNLALATYRRVWGLFSPRNNPFMKISKRKIDKSRHRQVVTEDDIRRIFEACRDDEERAVWGVGVYTGLRCVDVSNLTYGALSKDLTTITWTPQKTRRHMPDPLTIPICPTLKGLLTKVLDWRKIGNEDFKDELLWGSYKARCDQRRVPEWFARTLKKANLNTSEIDATGHRHVLTGYHITRLAFVSFASKYMSPLLVSKIVGHSSLEMTEHYCQNNQEALREGISQMPDFTNGAEAPQKPSEEAQVMELINSIRLDGESPIECLKRLIAQSVKVAC